jgi:signal transduction histidine kinase
MKDKVATEIVEELQRTTEDHRINMTLVPVAKIYGDKERIGQVLSNLVSNAIKYSPVSADINVTSSASDGNVTFWVQDRGIGIPEEDQHKVFERFYRVSGPQSNSFPGLGLGLYIAYEIINRQGGKIWVESEKGKGSTFCFSLPFDYRMNIKKEKKKSGING